MQYGNPRSPFSHTTGSNDHSPAQSEQMIPSATTGTRAARSSAIIDGLGGLAAQAVYVRHGVGYILELVFAFAVMFSALLACVMSHSESHPESARLSHWLRLARFSGRNSYSLYMVHFALVGVLLRPPIAMTPIGGKGPWSFVIYILLANAGAIAFYYLFERRTPELRRWLSSMLIGKRAAPADLGRG